MLNNFLLSVFLAKSQFQPPSEKASLVLYACIIAWFNVFLPLSSHHLFQKINSATLSFQSAFQKLALPLPRSARARAPAYCFSSKLRWASFLCQQKELTLCPWLFQPVTFPAFPFFVCAWHGCPGIPNSNKTTGSALLASGLYGPKCRRVFYYYFVKSTQRINCFFCYCFQISLFISVVNLLKTVPEFKHNFQLNVNGRLCWVWLW